MRKLDTVEGWKNLLWSNEIYTCDVCGGSSGSPIRQRLTFLNERFLVSALVKPNDLLMVKLDGLHRIWINSNCLSEWWIVRESKMVSRAHFFTEFDLRLGDLTFVSRLHI
jgi:hypothetical protein